MVMNLKSCCCGFSLKTGRVHIGVLSGIGSFSTILRCILVASASTGQLQKELIKELEKHTGSPSPAEYDHAVRQLQATTGNTTLSVFFICFAIVKAIHLIFDILMVFGASAERPRMIKPWIVYTTLLLLVQFVLGLVGMNYLFLVGSVVMGVVVLVILAVGTALGAYFILVVNSFHTHLLSNNSENKI